MNVQSVALDVTKQPQISPVLYLGQGDKNGTTLEAAIYDDGTALALTGKSARFCMRTPNGTGYYECDGTVSGNTATFLIDETYAATVDGITDVAYVEILEGSTVICSTNRFRVVVLQNATEDADPNGAYTNGVQRFLDDAADQLEEFEESTVGAIDEARQQVDEAVEEADAATARAIAAAEAAEGIVLQDIPTMSPTVKGGATLGSGLTVDDGALSLGDLVQSGSGAEVVTDGCAIFSVDGEGWSEQRTTTGKNLLPDTAPTASSSTATRERDKLTIVATSGSNSRVMYENVMAAGTYTFSAEASTNNSDYPNISIRTYINGTYSEDVTLIADGIRRSVTLTVDSAASLIIYAGYRSHTTDTTAILVNPQLEAGSTATSYEPYTGGLPSPRPDWEQPIEVCRGRNLLDESQLEQGGFNSSGLNTSGTTRIRTANYIAVEEGQTYCCAFDTPLSGTKQYAVSGYTVDDFTTARTYSSGWLTAGTSFTVPSGVKFVRLLLSVSSEAVITPNDVSNAQLEPGTTPTPYVPYGHVGLKVTHDGTTTVTPIPLPTKGFAASLPDGTADALTVDSAGRWEWVNESGEVVFDGSSDEQWSSSAAGKRMQTIVSGIKHSASNSTVANGRCSHFAPTTPDNTYTSTIGFSIDAATDYTHFNSLGSGTRTLDDFKTWLASNNVTLLYPLATPTTEHGYIDLPALPSGAVVSIPELESIGVAWFVDGCEPIVEHAANMARRETEENESIEDALAELAARVAALES